MKNFFITTISCCAITALSSSLSYADQPILSLKNAESTLMKASQKNKDQAKRLLCQKGNIFQKTVSLCRSGKGAIVNIAAKINKDAGGLLYATCSLMCAGYSGYNSSHVVTKVGSSLKFPKPDDKDALKALFKKSAMNLTKSTLATGYKLTPDPYAQILKRMSISACAVIKKHTQFGDICQDLMPGKSDKLAIN